MVSHRTDDTQARLDAIDDLRILHPRPDEAALLLLQAVAFAAVYLTDPDPTPIHPGSVVARELLTALSVATNPDPNREA